MEDPVFRAKYRKCKIRVKQWEKSFKQKYGRVPSKHDIRDSPSDIRNSYKMYYKLKTSLLEDTLLDALDDEDDFDSSLVSQVESGLSRNSSFHGSTGSLDASTFAELGVSRMSSLLSEPIQRPDNEFEAEEELPQNSKAWDASVLKPKKAMEDNKPAATAPTTAKPIGLNAAKLFASPAAVIPKRNPRKSIANVASLPSSVTDSVSSGQIKMQLPDLETLLNEKSKEIDALGVSSASGGNFLAANTAKELVNDVDEGWLNRCSETAPLVDRNDSQTTTSSVKTFGLKNVDVSAIRSNSSFGMSALSMEPINKESDGREQVVVQPTAYDRIIQSDSDDIVENSEDESTKVSPAAGRHVVKKRKVFTSLNRSVSDEPLLENGGKQTESTVQPDDTENCEPKTATKEAVRESKKEKVTKKQTKKVIVQSKNLQSVVQQRRMSTRGRKPVSYEVLDKEQGDDDWEPFDDEDIDPNFNLKPEQGEVEEDQSRAEKIVSNKEDIIADKAPVAKVSRRSRSTGPAKLGRKRASKKSPVSPKLSAGKEKAKTKPKAMNKVANAVPDGTDVADQQDTAYVPEFGTGSLTNVPRVDLEVLKRSNRLLEGFINKASTMEDIVGARKTRGGLAGKNTKESALRQKIAAGKLNENFVRVDLRKKVFVKGKKTINFSRYKKSLWKKKKAAALCGPEMDMGGCDGGVLTCFQCGGTGHMARQCKVKGEQLLPLGEEVEDESSFPTLEEAETMAKAKAGVVHANRIDSLPVVDNPTWKNRPEKEMESSSQTEVAQPEAFDDPVEGTSKPPAAYIGHTIPVEFLRKSGLLEVTVGTKDVVEPLHKCKPDFELPTTPTEVFEALRMFGHKEFRYGQEKAVMRVLCGISTLVTLSTGSGKSLCYQLPAYLYGLKRRCVTLVISPLVSLMEDQVHGVPDFLRAYCLHMNQTPRVRERTMEAISTGAIDVLLISPEAVVSGEKSTGFGSLLRQLPPIAFACIDEAHCVSQWSHNFRPSYLMICRVLKEKLGVSTVLGLTATATMQTRESIVSHLAIPDGLRGIISDIPLPDNLLLTVSKDVNRDQALVALLLSERFQSLESIIVYCTRRDDCERIATFVRTCFQDASRKAEQQNPGNKGRKRKMHNYVAETYHAGMPASRRRTIQNAFMSGELRIVVATIAFGMGINKSDIRAIIHYNMPKNFESYVQEVGRAGRDGLASHCHLFLDSRGNDRNELRRFIFANSIDRHVIRKLLQKIFVPCACVRNLNSREFTEEHRKQIEALGDINWNAAFDAPSSEDTVQPVKSGRGKKRVCPGHEICFSVESTVQQLDIPEENIETMLCYLELHEARYIQVLSKAYIMCKIMSYAGAKPLRLAAKDCPPLAMAIALDLQRGVSHDKSTFIEFPVIDVAAAIGWDSGVVKYQLKNLEWTMENNSRKRSTLSVSFFDLGFRVRAPGDLSDEELDETLDALYGRATSQETAQLLQLQSVSEALESVCFKSYHPIGKTDCPIGSSEKLKTIVREYFQTSVIQKRSELAPEPDDTPDEQLIADIRVTIFRYPENNFSGRAIARIFHGVQSPNYPAVIWARSNLWRAHQKTDFNRIVRLANAEIVRMKT